ncbi:virulence factor BrkB family protein [Alginatibacterium sediminis]|uniref:UPF0761 membrane protein DBZ36_19770 n=1 Tax=Alginatibacterium sediminis TaxID=2164068 RepID=A0A420E6C7_9ALTE|nr:virulence factor BrkB family protein [Alginatibacterium sediminis]RKF13298.1 virulence factor BrkB family protein [Alginatibacterium sediminis]
MFRSLPIKKLPSKALVFAFFKYLGTRFLRHKINVIAGSLAYVSLLSLVPLCAVVFSLFSAFPVFEGFRELIESYVYQNMLPTSGDTVRNNINGFIDNASRMTTIGVSALIVVALMLISAIDNALNMIWENAKKRSFIKAIPVYWMILTLGPILLGGSLAISSYMLSVQLFTGTGLNSLWADLLSWTPVLFSITAFTLLYLLVPNKQVGFRHALVGGIFAALAFEASKRGFAFYVSSFPSYQIIYGALAVLPILLVWVYVIWLVVLTGAEIAASLDEFDPNLHGERLIESLDTKSEPRQS